MPLYYGNLTANTLTVTEGNAGVVPVGITGAAGQTSDFLDVTYSGGTAGQMFSVVPASASTQVNGVKITTGASGANPAIAANGTNVGLNLLGNGNSGVVAVSTNSGAVPFTVFSAAGQTVDFLDITESGGAQGGIFTITPSSSAAQVDGLKITSSATANPATVTIAASGSDTNVGVKITTLGTGAVIIQGTGTNDNAAAGFVGEFIQGQLASGSATALSTGTSKTVTSISLTAGDWNVWGVVDVVMTGATVTNMKGGTNTTTNILGGQDTFVSDATNYVTDTDTNSMIAPMTRYSLSTTTTVFLIAQSTFSVGTCTAYGTINARRVR